MRKKAQISIFIILMVLVVFLFVFLFSSVSEKEEQKIDEAQASLKTDTDEVRLLRDHVNSCLDIQLTRALILAGYRGGYIYEGEVEQALYGPSIIHSEIYSDKFLENLDLSLNYLVSETLLHHIDRSYTPTLESSLIFNEGDDNELVIYEKSIKEDFEKFMLDEFMKCIDLDSYREKGFEVEFEEYAGKVLDIQFTGSGAVVDVENLQGVVGNKVRIHIGKDEAIGNITSELQNGVTKVTFGPNQIPGDFSIEITSLLAVNIDTQTQIIVDFKDESVVSKLYFPILFTSQDTQMSVKTAQQISNVRFKKLLELSGILLRSKELNKSLDYNDFNVVNSVIVDNGYLQSTELRDLRFSQTILDGSEENKYYVFSLIDGNSKLSGNPYIFNFAYENQAPQIDLETAGFEPDNADNNTFYVVVPTNQQITYNLDNILEFQAIDRFKSHYIEQEIQDTDAYFRLTTQGELTFEATKQRRYAYDIVLTDDEAQNTYTVVMLAGLPDNENNQGAQECFAIKTNGNDRFYPVEAEFRDTIQTYTDPTSGYVRTFAYSLYQVSQPQYGGGVGWPILTFRPSCMFDTENFNVEVEANTLNSNQVVSIFFDQTSGNITLPSNIAEPIEVKATIVDQSLNPVVEEPFVITIHPASCLGPAPMNAPGIGGQGTCCDIAPVLASRTSDPLTMPSFIGNLDAGATAIDTQMYFSFDAASQLSSEELVDYSEVNIWEEYDVNPTALYKGNVESVCGGIYPRWEQNIASITPPTSSALSNNVKAFVTETGVYRKGQDYGSIGFSVSLEANTQVCQFVSLENTDGLSILLDNDLPLLATFVTGNSYDILPLQDVNEVVLCDETWYGSHDGILEWLLNFGYVPEDAYRSQVYCEAFGGCERFIPEDYTQGNRCILNAFANDQIYTNERNPGETCDYRNVSGTCYQYVCNDFLSCVFTNNTVSPTLC